MIKIRLMRIGSKRKPFYRVVAVDERAKRTGGYLELLGTYNPLTEPHDIKLKQDRIDYWIKMGAQSSDGFLRIIGKAPQRPPRKPKKEKKESSAVSQQSTDKPEEKASAPAKPEDQQQTAKEAPDTTPEMKAENQSVSNQSSDKKVEETQSEQAKEAPKTEEPEPQENAPQEEKSES